MKQIIKRLKPKLQNIFDYLHTHPEISWKEFNTTKYIKNLLSPLNCRIKTFEDMTGLVVEIGQGDPVVALRADIDALWQEVDGKEQANHSCGHDAHMTIAIGVLLTLLEMEEQTKGTFRFLFQPAEEKGEGALGFIKAGVVDDVDYLYGMHLRPIQELSNGFYTPALDHGAAMLLKGEIIGDDAHGARPHLNSNAIQVGAELVQHLNNVHIDPFIPYSVKLTSFHAGGESLNIIPGNASFSIDMRAQSNEGLELIKEKVDTIINMLRNYYKVEIDLQVATHIVAAELNDEATNIMRKSIISTVGEDKLTPVIQTTGGDDFHFFTVKRPEIKATMLGIGCDLKPGLHHPNMTFNFAALPEAVEVLTRALINSTKNL